MSSADENLKIIWRLIYNLRPARLLMFNLQFWTWKKFSPFHWEGEGCYITVARARPPVFWSVLVVVSALMIRRSVKTKVFDQWRRSARPDPLNFLQDKNTIRSSGEPGSRQATHVYTAPPPGTSWLLDHDSSTPPPGPSQLLTLQNFGNNFMFEWLESGEAIFIL